MSVHVEPIGEDPKPAPMTEVDLPRLFPPRDEVWTFENAYEPAAVVRVRAKVSVDGAARRVVLAPEGPITGAWPPLFVKLGVSRSGVALEHFWWATPQRVVAFPIAPPLVVTPRAEDDRVAVLVAQGYDWSYSMQHPPPAPLVPPVPGRAEKAARTIALPGVPGRLLVLSARITAQNSLGHVILDGTMQFVEGLGLVTHVGQTYGPFFVLRRRAPLLPNTPPPVQPVFGIPAVELLGLATMKLNTYRRRGDNQERTLASTGGPQDFRLTGEVPVPIATVRVGGQGLELVEMRVWGQPWTPPQPLAFSTRLLNLAAQPSWGVWSFAKPGVKGPSGQELATLALRITWSDDASDAGWAEPGAGDYQNYRARYLRVEYQAVDVAGKPLPLEQTVFALTNQGLGILRVVHRTGTGTPEFWDLYTHA